MYIYIIWPTLLNCGQNTNLYTVRWTNRWKTKNCLIHDYVKRSVSSRDRYNIPRQFWPIWSINSRALLLRASDLLKNNRVVYTRIILLLVSIYNPIICICGLPGKACAVITFSQRRDRRVAVILQYLSGQKGTGDFVRNGYSIVDCHFAI